MFGLSMYVEEVAFEKVESEAFWISRTSVFKKWLLLLKMSEVQGVV